MSDDEHQETSLAAGEQLARWLRALAVEVERDPALAERIARVDGAAVAPATAPAASPIVITPAPIPIVESQPVIAEADSAPPSALKHRRRSSRYGAPTVAGRAADLGKGIPDPFVMLATADETGLRRALETLRAGTLRAIIRAHNLDPNGKIPPEATEKRMISLIVAATKRAAKANAPTNREAR